MLGADLYKLEVRSRAAEGRGSALELVAQKAGDMNHFWGCNDSSVLQNVGG
jgi:hypothetical protein